MPEQNIEPVSLETSIPTGVEIPKGDASISTTPVENTTSPTDSAGKNIFLEENKASTKTDLSVEDEETKEENFVSKYIRGFIIASIVTVIDIILLWLIYSYNRYITQASENHIDANNTYVASYKGYLGDVTNLLGMNYELDYTPLPVNSSLEGQANLQKTLTTDELSYIQKRDILKEKLTALTTSVTNKAEEIETIKKDIARYGFLPLEIRNILQNEETISAIQRSLNSLEIIKFSTALKVFSYMDSIVSIIGDALRMDKDTIFAALESFASRGERDVSSYVYMCYLNPFETSTDCTTIGDFDLYYQDILHLSDNDEGFKRTLFKNVMKYLDIMLEQSDIPSFSILFNGFNASSKTINFNIEVNTTKQDELRLINKDIKNPHIFIFTSLINLLKQSSFILGENIDTKTINIATRTIEVGNTSYTVNTSSKRFELPIQKSTEREIFDYIDVQALLDDIAVEIEEENTELILEDTATWFEEAPERSEEIISTDEEMNNEETVTEEEAERDGEVQNEQEDVTPWIADDQAQEFSA